MISYMQIPAPQKWLSDSSVNFAFRKNDVVLTRIDDLVKQYAVTTGDVRSLPVLGDLFFSIDYWLKIHRQNSKMEEGRQPAMYALYQAVAEKLCRLFGCTINGLPRELEFMFGRELSGIGAQVDLVQNRASYVEPQNLWQYRLRFKGGLAYQHPWWEAKVTKAAVLAESSRAYNKLAFVRNNNPNAIPNDDYGFFVMSMGREIYMMKHQPCSLSGEKGVYHSAYLHGGTAAAAGTMLIRGGKVLRVRSDSGHYKPQDTNMVGLLKALQMRGVSLSHVKVENFQGTVAVKAEEFVAANGTWQKFVDARTNTIADNKAAFTAKPGPDLRLRPDPRQMWRKPPEVKGDPFAIKPLAPPRM